MHVRVDAFVKQRGSNLLGIIEYGKISPQKILWSGCNQAEGTEAEHEERRALSI